MCIEQQDFHRLGDRDELGDVRLDSLDDVHRDSRNRLWNVPRERNVAMTELEVAEDSARCRIGTGSGQSLSPSRKAAALAALRRW